MERIGGIGIKPTDINFFLYSNPSKRNTCTEIIIGDNESIKQSGFDAKKKTKVLIHGFLAHAFAEFPRNVKNAYLIKSKNDYNVICVNWGPLSGKKLEDYTEVQFSLSSVAQQLAGLLAWMKKQTELDISQVHLVGHSLGAHICGFVGRAMKSEGTTLGRISALDAAGFGFPDSQMLAKTDAHFVDAYHTTSVLGTTNLIGHVDFFIKLEKPSFEVFGLVAGIKNHAEAHRIFSQTILDPPETNDVTWQVLNSPGGPPPNLAAGSPIFLGEYCKPGTRGCFRDIVYPFKNVPFDSHTKEGESSKRNTNPCETSKQNPNEGERSKKNADIGQQSNENTNEGEPSLAEPNKSITKRDAQPDMF